MEALNIEAEYRKYVAESSYMKWANKEEFVSQNLQSGKWIEDDGDYYTAEDWEAEDAILAEEYEQRILREQEEYERDEWAREQQAEYDDYWYNGL